MEEGEVTSRADGTHREVDEVKSTPSKLQQQQQLGGVNTYEHT